MVPCPSPALFPLVALLAAGRSARFGADKLGALLGGRALGAHAAEAALATGLPVVCIGAGPRPHWLPAAAGFAENREAAKGLSASVALAAGIAQAGGHNALVLHLADMPFVPAQVLTDLAGGCLPAACAYPSGRPGVPAAFPGTMYPVLQQLKGERGAGKLLAGLREVRLVACREWQLCDVDTPGALTAAKAVFAAQQDDGRRPA